MEEGLRLYSESPRWNLSAVGTGGGGQRLLGALALQLYVLIRVLVRRVCKESKDGFKGIHEQKEDFRCNFLKVHSAGLIQYLGIGAVQLRKTSLSVFDQDRLKDSYLSLKQLSGEKERLLFKKLSPF